MARQTPSAFSLKVGAYSAEALAVSTLSGSEGLGRLFDFRVEFFPKDGEPLAPEDAMGKDALLSVSVRDGAPRYLHGWVRGLESLGVVGGRRRYRVHVVPKLWRLTQTLRSRIFQGKAVPDILKAVLKDAGIDFRLALHGSYAEREYCVQYRESDFAFVSRLMEWEGLYYFFEHSEEAHTLVVVDKSATHASLPGGSLLPVHEDDGRAYEGEFFSHLEVVHRLRPGAVHLKDYDFEKPALDVSGKAKAPEGVAGLELYEYPAGFVAPGVGKAVAQARLEAAKVGGLTLGGEGIFPRLTPGFMLEVDTPGDGTFAGEYLVTEVVHVGSHPDVSAGEESLQGLYRNHFQLLPKNTPFRPRRTTPLPIIPGLQTATVVGPAGEEIHTDGHGRVKVQFHWDPEGKKDEKSSYWVRVGQPWGGVGWGHVRLPRMGQEVLVRFLEGDPDRPLITGVVYNGANSTPYGLPDEKTKSTLRSASSPGGDGFNELRLEDSAQAEEVFVHAQKDETLTSENDKTQEVDGFEALLVRKDRTRTVEGHQILDVTFDDFSQVRGHQTLRVQGHRTTEVSSNHDEEVEGNQSGSVAKNHQSTIQQAVMESVGAARALTIGAGYSVNVGLALNEAVGGMKSVEIAGLLAEAVAGSRQEVVAQDKQSRVASDDRTAVAGNVTRTTGKDWGEDIGRETQIEVKENSSWLARQFELKAELFQVIVNGQVAIRIEKSGRVQFFGKTLTLEGD
ncbi:type VI secretion system Vgr family protein [Corallococcus llansteffanensis]|uniref:type VI secretion system Vgr family protein n=1 Tax=Corallococcus llansteffanensis TaxID=2316731 RepID=UPI001FC99C5C|nr:type VI secretion system tip protein VgrG [Corallococcus llansteffanensis]